MYNPYALPSQRKKSTRKYYYGAVFTCLCIYETLALGGGVPNPALASFWGIMATYILRDRWG